METKKKLLKCTEGKIIVPHNYKIYHEFLFSYDYEKNKFCIKTQKDKMHLTAFINSFINIKAHVSNYGGYYRFSQFMANNTFITNIEKIKKLYIVKCTDQFKLIENDEYEYFLAKVHQPRKSYTRKSPHDHYFIVLFGEKIGITYKECEKLCILKCSTAIAQSIIYKLLNETFTEKETPEWEPGNLVQSNEHYTFRRFNKNYRLKVETSLTKMEFHKLKNAFEFKVKKEGIAGNAKTFSFCKVNRMTDFFKF